MRLEFTVEGPIATIRLNRPEAMNSIDSEMREALLDACDRIRADDAIRAVILTGTGRAFCTGSDLKNTFPPEEGYARTAFTGAGDSSSSDILKLIEKPIVCAINGFALAGGLELALACDIRISAEGAKFGLPEVAIGSIPGAGGTQRLPRIVGLTNAMHMLLTGERIDTQEALRIGIVSRIVPAEELMEAATAIAAKIAANAPLAVRAVKQLALNGADMTLEAGIRAERMAWGVLRNTEDRIEGRKAFAEKRPPVYRGR
jgi:E-phenylitaconyl-CoA hydratase